MHRDQSVVLRALCLVGLGLLLVGILSGTLVRHVVQITPIVLAAVITRRAPSAGASLAVPILVFWFGIAAMIWLYLAGLSTFARGSYSGGEIVVTLVMAMASVWGVVSAWRLSAQWPPLARVGVAIVGLLLQLAAMFVSFRPAFVDR